MITRLNLIIIFLMISSSVLAQGSFRDYRLSLCMEAKDGKEHCAEFNFSNWPMDDNQMAYIAKYCIPLEKDHQFLMTVTEACLDIYSRFNLLTDETENQALFYQRNKLCKAVDRSYNYLVYNGAAMYESRFNSHRCVVPRGKVFIKGLK